jgi:hypothetical protein
MLCSQDSAANLRMVFAYDHFVCKKLSIASRTQCFLRCDVVEE